MGNNSNKLRRKKVLVCLVGGYTSAIMITCIAKSNVLNILAIKKQLIIKEYKIKSKRKYNKTAKERRHC
jgi:hypothetical protein